jgi:chemotaxis protein CheD
MSSPSTDPPAPVADVEDLVAQLSSGQSEWLMVDIGGIAVTNSADEVLSTSAPVGSCVAVCLWESNAHVSGLLHFLLPDSKSDPAQAETSPAKFADTGLMVLLDEAARLGAKKSQCKVCLVGGAQVDDRENADKLAKRNVLAARSALWKAGILLDREEVGGNKPRKATLSVSGGELLVKVEELEHRGA